MGRRRTDEIRADAVRVALTSGLTCEQVASDLGVGFSTLNKWVTSSLLLGSACLHARERGLPRRSDKTEAPNGECKHSPAGNERGHQLCWNLRGMALPCRDPRLAFPAGDRPA